MFVNIHSNNLLETLLLIYIDVCLRQYKLKVRYDGNIQNEPF
jgi:hypothetical protein